ncbi:hypothetical protein OF83DRAFT_1090691 [Amylostereum chailletii]|nr:hypothetical protein OF83DRAFT_1090691 [Amylostereum chailletii]
MFRALLSRSSGDRSVSLVDLEEGDAISINVEAVYAFFLPAPPRLPWREVAGVCGGALAPVCRAVQATVQSEFDTMAHFFAELEFSENASMERPPSQIASSSSDFSDGKNVPSPGDEPLILRNASPAIPTIIITPCDTESRESSCWVPLQDACFGQRLVVPSYPVANDVYPPLLAKPRPLARKWEYANGHWRAVLPTLDEQVRRGWFSRTIVVRRRPRHWR